MPKLDDLAALRGDTPGCEAVVHLNNAGSSLPPRSVSEAVERYRREEHLRGGYETADAHRTEIEGFYEATARLLNAASENIAFAASATDAYNKALSAIPFQPGDALVTTELDYASNQIAFLYLQKRWGLRLLRARQGADGVVDVESVAELMEAHRPRLVAVTHVPTNSGAVQPVEAIGALCRAQGVWYLVDACQSAGQLPLDVRAIGCDFLSATLRKFLRGPRGAGFLYAAPRALDAGLEPAFPDLHGATWTDPDAYRLQDSARRFEYFEKPYDLLLGSRAAVEYALAIGLENIQRRVAELADYTRTRLQTLPGIRVLDRGPQLCGIVTAAVAGWEPAALREFLRHRGIHTSIVSRNSAVLDFDRKGVRWALRISPHYFNTEAEIERLVEALKERG